MRGCTARQVELSTGPSSGIESGGPAIDVALYSSGSAATCTQSSGSKREGSLA